LGDETVDGIGTGVDPDTGALLLEPDIGPQISIDSGEVVRCRVR
jgi:hypothetical protein